MATTLATELALIGLVMRATPLVTTLPPDESFPTIAAQVPLGQLPALQLFDSMDPSHTDDDATIPAGTGRRTLRALSRLQRAGLLDDWHAFLGNDGKAYVHMRFTRADAARFYSWIDWTASTLPVSSRRPEHTFLGD
jgi:hypothetical protein